MKVMRVDGTKIEIPNCRNISGFSHTHLGDVVPVTHQWPGVVVRQRGYDPAPRGGYHDAAFFFQGEVFFPLTPEGESYRKAFADQQESESVS